jgi:hypothetical protein
VADDRERRDDATCPLCRGNASVEVVGETGVAREMECELCRGRGTLSLERVRYALERLSTRFALPESSPRYCHDQDRGNPGSGIACATAKQRHKQDTRPVRRRMTGVEKEKER